MEHPKKEQKRDKTPTEALAALMRLASRGERSSGDARRLMRGWGIAPAEAEKILSNLTEQRFIDDERYAAAYTREKMRLSGWGVHKIRAALAAKGVSREIVDRATAGLDPRALADRLDRYLERRMRTVKAATPYELRTKLIRYALSLGYDYETAGEAVEKITRAER